MDNLRLEHPGPFSSHTQAGTHHLLNFAPSIEFSSQLSKPTNNHPLHTHPLSPWASLWADHPHASPLLKNDLQSPEHGSLGRPWNVSVDPISQLKHGSTSNLTEFPHPEAPMESLREASPTLQLKHSSTILSSEFPHLVAPTGVLRGNDTHFSAPMNALRGDSTHLSASANAFRKENTNLSSILVSAPLCMDKGSTSPVSVASGLQPIPLMHKLDGIGGQNLDFAGLSQHKRDDSERALSMGRDGVVAVKSEVMGENYAGITASDMRGCNQHGFDSEEKGIIVKKEQGGVTIASLEDGSIGLKLGKRTYYAGGEEASKRANSSSACNGSGKMNSSSNNISSGTTTTTTATTTTINNNSSSNNNNNNNNNKNNNSANKKQKGSSVSTAVPACQAEGCTADLSGAKDYHRRHKVCELHSKASKAKVNNLEQRFCQQCSRFHVLSAFDEGKRSCRRRLAGHNERRRKPPAEPMPFLSPGGFAYFADSRANASLHDHPYFLQHRRASMVPASIDNAVLACHLGLAGFQQQETMGNYHALELHHFMQGLPPGGGSGVGLVDGGGALMLANGNGLALSNASSLTTPPSSSPVGLIPHVSSEMAISGRALSLLSSSLGSPETMSISLGMTSPSIDQFFSETHALASSRQVAPNSASCFIPGMGMISAQHGIGHNHNHALNSLTSSSSGCSTEIDQGEPPTMSSFEGRQLFLMHSENGFQNLQDGGNSHHGRPMLDLMHVSPGESHDCQQPQAELSYRDLQGLSIFGRSNML